MGLAYLLTFLNGKRYVGITTKTVEKRFRNHVNNANHGKNYPICKAIRKYGADSVKVEILTQSEDWEFLCKYEKEAIRRYNTFGELGYNCTEGGEGTPGRVVTQETRDYFRKLYTGRTLSVEHRENIRKNSARTKHTDEHKQYISNLLRGRVFSEETKRKISEARRENPRAPRIPSPEEVELFKQRAAQWRGTEEAKQMLQDMNARKRKRIKCLQTGEVFESSLEAAKHFGLKKDNITTVCRGVTRSCGGLIFDYVDQPVMGKVNTPEEREKTLKILENRANKSHLPHVPKYKRKPTPIEVSRKRCRPIVSMDTGEKYENSFEAEEKTGIKRAYIVKCCNGIVKTANGKVFKYA